MSARLAVAGMAALLAACPGPAPERRAARDSAPIPQRDGENPPLRLAAGLVFEDVPAPEGFRLAARDVAGNGPARTGLLVYEGHAALGDLEAFYQREMAIGDWREKERRVANAERVLAYAKGAERCVVVLDRPGGRARVTVRLNRP